MAGDSAFAADFDQVEFETGIRETMKMGMPEADAEKLTWWFKRDQEYSPADTAGNPFDWTDDPISDEPGNPDIPDPDPNHDQSLIVDYAIEFSSRPAGSTTTVLGEVDNSRAVVTLFRVDFEKIKTADYAKIDAATYKIQFKAPPLGLFTSTVVQVYLEAVDVAGGTKP